MYLLGSGSGLGARGHGARGLSHALRATLSNLLMGGASFNGGARNRCGPINFRADSCSACFAEHFALTLVTVPNLPIDGIMEGKPLNCKTYGSLGSNRRNAFITSCPNGVGNVTAKNQEEIEALKVQTPGPAVLLQRSKTRFKRSKTLA